MSLYVTWINLIKEKADENWLTKNQASVYKRILAQWKSQSFINLYGPPGCGKTFIARLLAKKHNYAYTHNLEQVLPNTEQVVLDNAQYTRMLRPVARQLGLGRVILITQVAVTEAMPAIKIELEAKDVLQFQAALSNYCDITFTQTIPEGNNLAEIIRQEVIKRGEANVNH